jgi:hypothetical protein
VLLVLVVKHRERESESYAYCPFPAFTLGECILELVWEPSLSMTPDETRSSLQLHDPIAHSIDSNVMDLILLPSLLVSTAIKRQVLLNSVFQLSRQVGPAVTTKKERNGKE